MFFHPRVSLPAVLLAAAVHVLVLAWVNGHLQVLHKDASKPKEPSLLLELKPLPLDKQLAPPPASAPPHDTLAGAASDQPLASMDAPPAPTAEEWAFAAKYTHKNSKGYRHNWGQQVRSMMGTATEGPDQGVVRFRIEIAPDGRLAKLDTLWSTSAKAEHLARYAIEHMPPLPPTPTGKPLVFEKTISFTPYANDGPPSYKDDCLPDTPAFSNPFAWDGASAPTRKERPTTPKLDPQAMEECLRQLPKDTLEAEMARDQRIMDQWGSSKTGR